MSFESYDALRAEIQSFLWDRTDVVAKIPSFITLAETEAKRLLRTRQTNERKPFTISGEISSIPCGSGPILAVRVMDGCTKDLDYVSPEQFSALSKPVSWTPEFYTIQNERMYFYPEGDFSGEIVFVEPFCSLSSTNRTNWLLREHPDIYLCGALKWAKAWLIDSDQDWATPFYSAIEAANAHMPRNG